MNILVLGGAGFIGKPLVKCLFEAGYNVTVVDLQENLKLNSHVEIITCDRKDEAQMKQIIESKSFDVVFDLCCFQLADMKLILELLGPIKHYILCSTVSVYDFDAVTALPIMEESSLKPETLEEYGSEKAQCEELLKASGLTYTIFRPCYVYGKEAKNYRLEYLIDRIFDKRQLLLQNNLEDLMHFIHVNDLVDAFVLSICDERVYNNVYNAAGHEYITVKGLIKLIYQCIFKKDIQIEELIKYRNYFLNQGMKEELLLNKIYQFSICFSSEKLMNDLKWKPKTNMKDGLQELCDYHLLNRQYPDYRFEDERLRKLEGM